MAPPPDEPSTIPAILVHLTTLADRLGGGSSADHVRRSVDELSKSVREDGNVARAVQRVMSSIRQLEGEKGAGRRREQQAAQPGIERLRHTLEQELLPALDRVRRL